MTTATSPRLKAKYEAEIRDALKATLGVSNVMQVPRIEKITLKPDGTPAGTEPLDAG